MAPMNAPAVDPNGEEQQYLAEVAEVKKWWTDSRWRYTKRPFTAEQIVAKRGNLRIQYPSNQQSKKLWNILEGRFKASILLKLQIRDKADVITEWRSKLHLWLLRAHHVDPDGEIPRYCLCFWLAIIFHCICI